MADLGRKKYGGVGAELRVTVTAGEGWHGTEGTDVRAPRIDYWIGAVAGSARHVPASGVGSDRSSRSGRTGLVPVQRGRGFQERRGGGGTKFEFRFLGA